jgi:hypothetical protein
VDIELSAYRHAEELRQTWQGRLLAATATDSLRVPSNLLQAIILSILAHCFDDTDAMPVLLRVLFPGFESLAPPFVCSIAHIDKAGRVVADTLDRNGWARHRDTVLFMSAGELQAVMRGVADKLKFSDFDRRDFFKCVQMWCMADHRRDPAMDPADPDSKRFKYH